jgi:hypothetical protein
MLCWSAGTASRSSAIVLALDTPAYRAQRALDSCSAYTPALAESSARGSSTQVQRKDSSEALPTEVALDTPAYRAVGALDSCSAHTPAVAESRAGRIVHLQSPAHVLLGLNPAPVARQHRLSERLLLKPSQQRWL